jgi:PAS domain S-box-containing protein
MFVSDAVAELLSCAPVELERTLSGLFHHDDQDVLAELTAPVVAESSGIARLRLRRGKSYLCTRCTFARTPAQGVEPAVVTIRLRAATSLVAPTADHALAATFNAMMENTDDYIYLKDRNHVVTGASRALRSTTGHQELVGKSDYDLFPVELADRYYALEKKVFASNLDVGQELHEIRRADGSPGWIDNRKYAIRDGQGQIVGLFAIARDITRHKGVEDALARLQAFTRELPGMVFELVRYEDGRYAFLYVSDACHESFGVTPEDVVRDPRALFGLVDRDDLKKIRASLDQDAQSLVAYSGEYRVRLPDGRVRHMFMRATPRSVSERAVHWTGFCTDITEALERRAAETDLRIAATAFEVHDAKWVTDGRGQILKVNSAFTSITGFAREDAVGKTSSILSSGMHGPTFYAAMWRSLADTGRWEGEIQNRRKNADIFPAWLSIAAVKGTDGAVSHYVGSLMDMTERRRLEEQLRQSQKLEAVGQLAGGIAHDFNNLLTLILSYTSLAIDELPAHLATVDDLREVKHASERAQMLTRQLLAFSRKQVLEVRTIDLNARVSSSVALLRRTVGDHIQIITSCAPELRLVRADPAQLDQVLMNLALNARDAMASGGTLRITTANVGLDGSFHDDKNGAPLHGDFVELTVADTGPGIPADIRDRIFEPFFTTKDKSKGTGLGLSMVHGIVNQSGGFIRVETELGAGTTFRVFLPCSEDGGSQQVPALEPLPAAPTQGRTILLVEDNLKVLKLTSRILQRAGYEVLTASGGEEALALAGSYSGTIHLLLTDIAMPGMNGVVLASRITSILPEIQVLFVSAHAESALGEQGLLDEKASFLSKPFSAAALTEKVRAVLALQRE